MILLVVWTSLSTVGAIKASMIGISHDMSYVKARKFLEIRPRPNRGITGLK